jgi:Concanavalin A-like lectin/glucanases superfamily
MKTKFIIILFGLSSFELFSHEVIVHRTITANASASALGNSGYADFLNLVAADCPTVTATNAMLEGSAHEDDAGKDEGGNRSYNHFYDPLDSIYGKGLSDAPFVGRVIIGKDSFTWASTSNCLGYDFHSIIGSNVGTSNKWSWQNARGYEWLGLTVTNSDARFSALTNMFRAVGQVMHLLEDASQPQHVRNEQHVFPTNTWIWRNFDPFISPIEQYGKNHVNELNYGNGSILDWQGDGFTKLNDFWDRGLYNSDSSKLNADTNGGSSTLGLAEWCNGNFLGARYLFPEYFKPGDIEYYPYPSRNTSTDYSDVKLHPENHVSSVTLEDKTGRAVVTGNAIYLKKIGDGVIYNHIARINYLGAKIPNLVGSRYCTIDDPNVLNDYHNVFIPKAVEYSAGILDYFFRGTLSATTVGYDPVSMQYTNLIMNTCGTNMGSGTFFIYMDNTNDGTRTLIAQTNFTGVLPDSQTFAMTFSNQPAPYTNKLLLVFQGNIGVDNSGTPLDPVDANIAIAADYFDISNRPIALWRADGDAKDAIGNHDGVLENVTFTTGQIGEAFAFDPETYTNVRVRIPDSPDFILTHSLSIEGWVRPRGDGGIIFFRGDNRPGFDPYSLSMQDSNTITFAITGEDGSSATVGTTLNSDQWQHVAATLDAGNGSMKIYVNGVLAAQTTTAIRPLANLISGDDPGIGIGNTHEDSNDFAFYGDVDQISLYSRALSPVEILNIYNAGLAGKSYY